MKEKQNIYDRLIYFEANQNCFDRKIYLKKSHCWFEEKRKKILQMYNESNRVYCNHTLAHEG